MKGVVKLVDKNKEIVSQQTFYGGNYEINKIKVKWIKMYPKLTDENFIVEWEDNGVKEKYVKPKVDHRKVVSSKSGRKVPSKPHLDSFLNR